MTKGVEIQEHDIITRLSLALANLHMAGYREGYNAKTMEYAKTMKEGNNPVLRVKATNTWLEGLKLEKSYAKETEAIMDAIKDLLIESRED